MLHEIVPIVRVEDFYRDDHQIIYRAIRDLYDLGKPVDVLILSDELSRRGEYDKIGGFDTLSEILGGVPHAANAKYHAGIVREKSVIRQVIEASNEIIREGYSNSLTSDDVLEGAERRIFAIAEEGATGETVELCDVVTKAMDRIALRSESKHPITGVGTGYFELDDMTSGFQAEQLIILAARPSMGKTAFALNICEHVAVTLKKAVLFVSLEMGSMELVERLLCGRSRVDGQKLRSGQNIGTREMAQLGRAYEEMRETPLFIDDTPARNMLQITANARRLKMRKDLGLIVVDYIQLIDSEGDGRESRQEQIAKISRRLKTLGPRAESAGRRALAAQSRRRESRGSKAQDGRPPRVGRHRAGRRRDPPAAPPRILRRQRPARRGRMHHRQEPKRSNWDGQDDLPQEHHEVRKPCHGGRPDGRRRVLTRETVSGTVFPSLIG